MKITILKIRETNAALQSLAQTKLPAVVSMKIAAVMRALQGPTQDFDRAFNALLADCGDIIEGTQGQYKIRDENVERFNKEATDLHAMEIDIPGEPIPAQLLSNAEVSPAVLASLDWLIVL